MKTIVETNASDEPRTPEQHTACVTEMERFIEANRPAIASIAKALEMDGCRIQLRIEGRPGGHSVQFSNVGAA